MDASDRQEGGPKHKKHKQHRGAHCPPAPRPAASVAPVDLPLPEGGIHIDGSMLEGGGQILRNASALSAILQRPLKVDEIRAGRDKPGLRPQHLTGLQLISELSSGQLLGGQALPPGACLPAIDLTERGEITGITVRAFTAGRLVPTIGERLAAAAQKEIKARMPRCGVSRQTPLTIEVVQEPAERAFGDGCGILITAVSSTGCVFGASGLGERGVPAEAIGERAATELMDVLGSGACTDEWQQDQLVIFMAVAQGRSRVLTGEPTLHTRTACMVAEALTGAKFRITPQRQQAEGSAAQGGGSGGGLWVIQCEGAAVPAPAP